MTVITLRGLRVAELRNFSVIGVEVRSCDIFMTPAALRHNVKFESLLVGTSNRVGTVAIVADRQLLVAPRFTGRMDAAFELLLDPVVTLAAGCRKVLLVDAGR
jgi:hypothetical protein